MVRLKARGSLADFLGYKLFQFHYGTIKSHGRPLYGLSNEVSIPLWYD